MLSNMVTDSWGLWSGGGSGGKTRGWEGGRSQILDLAMSPGCNTELDVTSSGQVKVNILASRSHVCGRCDCRLGLGVYVLVFR